MSIKGQRTDADHRMILRLIRQARPYWLQIGAIFLLGLLSTPLALLTPLPLKIAVDSVLGSAPLPDFLQALVPATLATDMVQLLVLAAVLQVLVAVLGRLQGLASTMLRTWTGERLTLAFRARLFDHLQRLSLAFHDSRGTADSIYRVQYDAPAIQRLLIDSLIPLVSSSIMLIAMIYITLRIDMGLTLVALAISPALVLTTWAHRRRMKPRYKEVKRLESGALKVVQEVLGAVRVVKAFGREASEYGRFVDQSSEGLRARIRIKLLEGTFGLAVDTIVSVGMAAVLFLGVRGVQNGTLTHEIPDRAGFSDKNASATLQKPDRSVTSSSGLCFS